MLDELYQDLTNLAVASIGAVAILAEKAADLGKVCMEKGAETLEKSKELREELMRRGEQLNREYKERCANEALERLTAEEREELRRKLDELDVLEAEAAAAAAEEEKVIHLDVDAPDDEEN